MREAMISPTLSNSIEVLWFWGDNLRRQPAADRRYFGEKTFLSACKQARRNYPCGCGRLALTDVNPAREASNHHWRMIGKLKLCYSRDALRRVAGGNCECVCHGSGSSSMTRQARCLRS